MSTEEPVELKAIEAALAALAPTTGSLDRDRLMYLAGRASLSAAGEARRFRWAWPAATAAMTTVAAALLAVVSLRLAEPAPRIVERIVEVPVERTPAPSRIGLQPVGPALPATTLADSSPDPKATRDPDQPYSSPERNSVRGHDEPPATEDPWSFVARFIEWPTADSQQPTSLDSYPTLRNQLLSDGTIPGTAPPAQPVPANNVSAPASGRQMLDSLLDGDGTLPSTPKRPSEKKPIPLFPIFSGARS